MPHHSQELEEIAERIRISLESTPQLSTLFKYLWVQQERHVGHTLIWNEGGLKALCRSKDKHKATFDFRANVRQAVLDLRGALDSYFRKAKHEPWRIEIPDAIPGVGYQLSCVRIAIDFKMTGAIWKPHLQGGLPISVVYVEHLFFYDRDNGLVFRYYDCNQEHHEAALGELYKQHGALADQYPKDDIADPHSKNARLKAIYPYVAKGEAQAIYLLRKWFSNYAAVKIQADTTRSLHRDDIAEEDSLILVGSASSNRFIRKLLQRHQDAPITLENRARIRLSCPAPEEMERIAALEKGGCCRMLPTEDGCIIDFATDKSWGGILTRLPNPHTSRTPATIFNSDFGAAVHALTDFVTDEGRLTRGLQLLRIPPVLPDYFQLLYCVDAVRHNAKPLIQPIAWRSYVPTGI